MHPHTRERRWTRAAGNDGVTGSTSGLHSLPEPLRNHTNATSYIPNDSRYNPLQLDYILTSSRWASSVRQSHERWGVNIRRWGRRYDHGLVECKWQVRLATKRRIVPTPDYATLKYDPIVAAAYVAALYAVAWRQ